jgi:hypothetical protein
MIEKQLAKMKPRELVSLYLDIKLRTRPKERTHEITEAIEVSIQSLEIALYHVIELDNKRKELELNGGFE